MDYLYENLGEDRFQEFCQALVLKEFPYTQAFPTNQPDGGRDSITYLMNSNSKEFIVFQVKFVRNPLQIAEPHKWLIETLKLELPKIQNLIPRGATKYILITNVKGTAHLDNGSIDTVNHLFEKNVAIPSMCWWRDDISRRLENNIDLKWSYPHILDGQDILNMALFNQISEFKEKRENVIRAYLTDQYYLDDQVKFRQVDLQNRLLNLFTDVPIRLKKYNEKSRVVKRKIYQSYESNRTIFHIDEQHNFLEERQNFGAAEYLLSSEVQNNFDRILLEGGPGQGKSTISQYVCQIHRMHLLKKLQDLSLIPEKLKTIAVRLPFKIDLRHVAAWVENRNPYPLKLSEESFTKIWQKSLESFLLGHILYHSQLDGFERNDFIAICKLSPILLVFDGFDEIANLKIREDVIDLINKGLDRINENSLSVQVIITSRPAAFVDSVGFAVEKYPHFELADITPAITKEYVEKWIKASRLDSREGAEIKRLVQEKLEMPHLRDLAKSPMQLAIFISLLRKKGESLPNKRTALYDSYIELFFDRESEKSIIIRDNRDLIIDIHEYLGWILHSEAEMYKNSGSIEIGALKKLLKEYLEKEGHKTDITDQLFDVVKERVCALASRVQGTFEFEVQPLREYFCAKYLYKTSPYSPVGQEKAGTKPERFEAIAPNYYWQNTVRFFAGCFDKGELPMLIHQLKELQENPLLKYTNYPRLLTSQILSDWVFTQYPVLLKEVVKILINGINIGNVINQNDYSISTNEPLLLPLECGRDELVSECFEQLKTFPLSDYANELIGIIKRNPYNIVPLWISYAGEISGKELTKWFDYGYKMEILYKIDNDILTEILNREKNLMRARIQLVINSGKYQILNTHKEIKEETLNGVLDNDIAISQREHDNYSLKFLSSCLRAYSLAGILKSDMSNLPYFQMNSRRHGYYYAHYENFEKASEFQITDEIDESIASFKSEIKEIITMDISFWRSNLKPWEILVDTGRRIFNDHWSFSIIAVIGAGIRSKEEKYEDCDNLDDETVSLSKRVRYARTKSGNLKYWQKELQTEINIDLKLLIFFTWATPKVIIGLSLFLNTLVEGLSERQLRKLIRSLTNLGNVSLFSNPQRNMMQLALKSEIIIDKLKYIICLRFEQEERAQLIYFNTDDYQDQNILNLKLEYLIGEYFSDAKNEELLDSIKIIYHQLTNFSNKYLFHRVHSRLETTIIPLDIANKIMADSKSYPRIIASVAEKSCKSYAFQNTVAVGEIAKANNWFS
jgi:hypothetical protein